MKPRVPAETFPPGEFIRDEMNARGWSERRLADLLGMSRRDFARLLQGDFVLTEALAERLGEAFGVDLELFVNLEKQHRDANFPLDP